VSNRSLNITNIMALTGLILQLCTATAAMGCVRWFHSGGIFAALSETTSDVIIDGMQAAKKSGAVVSFDLNYRSKLWAPIGGLEKAQQVLCSIVENVDVLVGNEEDLQTGLGMAAK